MTMTKLTMIRAATKKHGVLELVFGRVVVNDPRSGREGDHKKTRLKKAPLSPQVHAADIPQDSRTHMDKKAKIS
jgi:hypothetical protein